MNTEQLDAAIALCDEMKADGIKEFMGGKYARAYDQVLEAARQHSSQLKAVTGDRAKALKACERMRQNGNLLPARIQSAHWQDSEVVRAALTAVSAPPVVPDTQNDKCPDCGADMQLECSGLTGIATGSPVPACRGQEYAQNDMPKRGAFFDMVWGSLKEVRGDMVKRMSIDNIQTFAGILYDKLAAAPQPTTQEHTGKDGGHD